MVMNWGTALIPNSPAWLWAVVFIAFNTFVNIRGIQMSRGVDWVIFVIEVLAVIAFIALGCNFIMGGGGAGAFVLDPIYQEGQVDAHFIAAGISLAALSFLGFDGMSTLAEETHEPEKNIGRGILIALCAIIVVFVAQTYIAAIVQPDWANTDPDMGFFDSVMLVGGPVFYKIMLVINIIAIGIANIMNAQMASSRLLYSMGRDGVIPKAFGKVHPKYQTPWFSAVFLGVVTLCLSIPMGDKMTQLAGLVNFGALASFILLNFAVFLFFFIREKKRNSFGDIVKYLICPWIGIGILVYVYLKYTKHGYEIAVVGESRRTASYAGIKVDRVIIRTMALSGALCGLIGLLLTSSTDHTMTTTIVDGRGFTAVMVSWMAKFNPIIMIFVSLLLVVLSRGASEISTAFGLNRSFSDILTGIILFFIIGCEFFINYKVQFRSSGKKEA